MNDSKEEYYSIRYTAKLFFPRSGMQHTHEHTRVHIQCTHIHSFECIEYDYVIAPLNRSGLVVTESIEE